MWDDHRMIIWGSDLDDEEGKLKDKEHFMLPYV